MFHPFQRGIHVAINDLIVKDLRLLGRSVYFASLFNVAEANAWPRNFFKQLIDGGLYELEDFRDAIVKGIASYGHEMYRHVCTSTEPDQVDSPDALAFAIRFGHISPSEISTIRFDHGETLEQFCARAEGLVDFVLKQLRDGPSPERQWNAETVSCHE